MCWCVAPPDLFHNHQSSFVDAPPYLPFSLLIFVLDGEARKLWASGYSTIDTVIIVPVPSSAFRIDCFFLFWPIPDPSSLECLISHLLARHLRRTGK